MKRIAVRSSVEFTGNADWGTDEMDLCDWIWSMHRAGKCDVPTSHSCLGCLFDVEHRNKASLASLPMAELIRSAKSGSDWTDYELFAFNIVIQNVDVETFFGVPHLPPTTISPVVLNNALQPASPAVISKEDRLFFNYLNLANIGEKSAVHDFACYILKMLNFDDNHRGIISRGEMSFTMCGTRVWAKADTAVLDNVEYSLLVQEGKVSCR